MPAAQVEYGASAFWCGLAISIDSAAVTQYASLGASGACADADGAGAADMIASGGATTIGAVETNGAAAVWLGATAVEAATSGAGFVPSE